MWEMTNVNMDVAGTSLFFEVSEVTSWEPHYFWTNAKMSVKNEFFDMEIEPSFVTYQELQELQKDLSALVRNELPQQVQIYLVEPYWEIHLDSNPDADVCCEFWFYPEIGGGFTDQYYCLPLTFAEAKFFLNYLNLQLPKLSKTNHWA